MTKFELIKEILQLGKKLEKSEGFDSLHIINDMEVAVETYYKKRSNQIIIAKESKKECEEHDCNWRYVGYQQNGHKECSLCGKIEKWS